MGIEPRGKDWKVAAALVLLALLFFVVGWFVSLRLSPGIGGVAGRSALYGLIAVLVIGVLLQRSRTPQAWPTALCATAFVFMVVLVYMAQTMAAARDRELAAYSAEQSLVTKMADGAAIAPAPYPESTFGDYAPTLTAMSLHLSVFQQKRSALEAKQKDSGPLDLDSPQTFTDTAKRSAASQELAALREVDSAALKDEQGLVAAIHADLASSPWPPDEKRELIAAFDKRAEGSIRRPDAYLKLALEIDALDQEMLDLAASDHARQGPQGLVFNTAAGLEKFKLDAARVKALARQQAELRARSPAPPTAGQD